MDRQPIKNSISCIFLEKFNFIRLRIIKYFQKSKFEKLKYFVRSVETSYTFSCCEHVSQTVTRINLQRKADIFNQNTFSTKFVEKIVVYLLKKTLGRYNASTVRYIKNKINAKLLPHRLVPSKKAQYRIYEGSVGNLKKFSRSMIITLKVSQINLGFPFYFLGNNKTRNLI